MKNKKHLNPQISIRFTDTEIRELLHRRAVQNNRSDSTEARDLIIKALVGTHENLLVTSLKNIHQKIEASDTRTYSLLNIQFNLFYTFLANWFTSHPAPTGNRTELSSMGLSRRDQFMKKFYSDLDSLGSIYETLLADHFESPSSSEEIQ